MSEDLEEDPHPLGPPVPEGAGEDGEQEAPAAHGPSPPRSPSPEGPSPPQSPSPNTGRGGGQASEPVPQSSPLPTSGEGPGERVKRLRPLHVLLALLALAAVYVLYQWITWPDVAALAETHPETTTFIERYERNHGGAVRQTWVPYGRISPHLKRAVLVSEDINFFDHDGFETREIRQALKKAWKEKEFPRGASTLTQQLAKNLWLSPSRNPLRKVEEAILTRQLEAHLTKRRIFELYLNVVELGPGVYGAEAAARHWFGVSAAGLSEAQAAQLAASLPRPKTWNPGTDSRGYRNRVRRIQRRMGKAQWLWKVI